MGTVSTILLFVVVTVMALAIIVLAVWAAKLSSQLKRLSDAIFAGERFGGAAGSMGVGSFDGGFAGGAAGPSRMRPSVPAAGEYGGMAQQATGGRAQHGAGWQPSQQVSDAGVTGAGMRPVGPYGSSGFGGAAGAGPGAAGVGAVGGVAASGGMGAGGVQWPSSAGAPQGSAGAAFSGGSGAPAGEMDFFERYKQHEDPNSTGGFGRPKPSIPFGEDRTVPNRRDAYAESAADFDIEPDSIDFSRVAGYRNVINR